MATGKPRHISESTDEELEFEEQLRLGPLADVVPADEKTMAFLRGAEAAVIEAPRGMMEAVISAKLRADSSHHRYFTVSDMFGITFDDDLAPVYRAAFKNYPQMFIAFGYVEAPNKRFPHLALEQFRLRIHIRKHVWIFLARPLAEMANRWDPVLLEFSDMPGVARVNFFGMGPPIETGLNVFPQPNNLAPPPKEEDPPSKDSPKKTRGSRGRKNK